MALSKQIISNKGITTNYHKVDAVLLKDNVLRCTLASYISKDYRNREQAADYFSTRFEITIEEEESMGIRALCYNKIKELENWADATDC